MVKRLYTGLLLGLVLFAIMITKPGHAQYKDELKFLITSNPPVQLLPKKKEANVNEQRIGVKLFALGLIKFYQKFISSQQNNIKVCTFTPSCSRFGAAAIEKCGIFYGVLLTADRLQRCNGLGRKNYPVDPETYKLSDPIDNYDFKNKAR